MRVRRLELPHPDDSRAFPFASHTRHCSTSSLQLLHPSHCSFSRSPLSPRHTTSKQKLRSLFKTPCM